MFEEIADENKALHEKISQQNQENDELKALMDSLNGKHEISDFSLSDALKALQKMTEKVFSILSCGCNLMYTLFLLFIASRGETTQLRPRKSFDES
jgi:hypothetical protein